MIYKRKHAGAGEIQLKDWKNIVQKISITNWSFCNDKLVDQGCRQTPIQLMHELELLHELANQVRTVDRQ